MNASAYICYSQWSERSFLTYMTVRSSRISGGNAFTFPSRFSCRSASSCLIGNLSESTPAIATDGLP